MVVLVLLGVCAGALTTVAGMGGGLFLVAAIGVTHGPHQALAATSLALLASNAHRAWLYRGAIDRDVARRIALGAVPGAALGGLVLPALSEVVVAGLMGASTVAALLRARGVLQLAPSGRMLTSAGVGVGALAATSGGGGMLVGPLVMSAGASGSAYVATVSTCAVAIHVGRVVGYGSSGVLVVGLLPVAATLVVGLVIGNLLGRRARDVMPPGLDARIEVGALVLATLLAFVAAFR